MERGDVDVGRPILAGLFLAAGLYLADAAARCFSFAIEAFVDRPLAVVVPIAGANGDAPPPADGDELPEEPGS